MERIYILYTLFFFFSCPCSQDRPLIMFEQNEASITKLVKLAKTAHHTVMGNGSQISFNNAISLHLKREALEPLQNRPVSHLELHVALAKTIHQSQENLQTCGPATILDTSLISYTELIKFWSIAILSLSRKKAFVRVLVSSDFFKTLPQQDQTIHLAIDDVAAQRLLEVQA